MMELPLLGASQFVCRLRTLVPYALNLVLTAENTVIVDAGTGEITIDVLVPSVYAGSYTVSDTDLQGGAFNIVPPQILGTAAPGEVLSLRPGLWLYDADVGQPLVSTQWRINGSDLAGETAQSYTCKSGDAGQLLDVIETAGGVFCAAPGVTVVSGAGSAFSIGTPVVASGIKTQADGLPHVFSAVATGVDDPARELFALVALAQIAGGALNAASVTIGGVAATQRASSGGSNGYAHVSLWSAVVGGTSADISVTPALSSNACAVALLPVLNGVLSGSDAYFDNPGDDQFALSVNTQSGDKVFAVMQSRNGDGWQWADLNTFFATDLGTGDFVSMASLQNPPAQADFQIAAQNLNGAQGAGLAAVFRGIA